MIIVKKIFFIKIYLRDISDDEIEVDINTKIKAKTMKKRYSKG